MADHLNVIHAKRDFIYIIKRGRPNTFLNDILFHVIDCFVFFRRLVDMLDIPTLPSIRAKR